MYPDTWYLSPIASPLQTTPPDGFLYVYGTYFKSDTATTYVLWKRGTTFYITTVNELGIPIELGAPLTGTYYPMQITSSSTTDVYQLTNDYYLWWDSDSSQTLITKAIQSLFYEHRYNILTDVYYIGDSWYILDHGAFAGRGTERGTTMTYTVKPIHGWSKSTTMYGEYNPVSGSGLTGKWYVGLERYTFSSTKYFIEQLNISENGQKTYYNNDNNKYLWFDNSNWIISGTVGVKSDVIGYWSRATIAGLYVLTYTGPPPSPTPATYTLSSKTWIKGSENEENYISIMGIM